MWILLRDLFAFYFVDIVGRMIHYEVRFKAKNQDSLCVMMFVAMEIYLLYLLYMLIIFVLNERSHSRWCRIRSI